MSQSEISNLARLNDLLENSSLDIPEFRRKVSDSGSNFPWLKKHLLTKILKLKKESGSQPKYAGLSDQDVTDLLGLLELSQPQLHHRFSPF